jgi:YjbE family integral membrane protein
MLTLPWLKLIGALLLLYIGVSLLMQEEDLEGDGKSFGSIFSAVRTILIADLVMSLDNVIAVAAAANGNTVLLISGLAISIPLVIFGSTLLLKVISRFPLLVWFGAALLGFIAGELLVDDPALTLQIGEMEARIHLSHHNLALLSGAVGAAIVVVVGKVLALRQQRAEGAA